MQGKGGVNPMEPLLEVKNLTVSYGDEAVLQDVSFTLQKGEILAVTGSSGIGKSTLLKSVTGLLGAEGKVLGGDILYRGKSILHMTQKELTVLRGAQIGMVFQDCGASLCPVRKVGTQIYEAVRAHERVTKAEVMDRTAALLGKIGLSDWRRIWNSYPFQLSGGMNQRVGICMAMLLSPSLLLADEPTSALDVTVQKQVGEELLLMRREYNTAMLLVTHNPALAEKMADRVLRL